MSSALDAIIERAECMVAEGKRDAEAIIRECYDLEVYDWFTWELLKAVFSADELVQRAGADDELIEYCISELEDEVQDMIEEREEVDGRNELLEEFGIDYDKTLGNRERDVVDNLDRIEFKLDRGHHLYKFIHTDGEHAFTWDNDDEKIVA